MGILGKIFGSSDPLGRLRKAVQQQRWADGAAFADEVNPATLAPSLQNEYYSLRDRACDALAELNLAEGEAFERSGDRERAVEHFALAERQARDPALLARIREAAERKESAFRPSPSPAEGLGGKSACCPTGCGPTAGAPLEVPDADLPEADRMELVLSAYSPDVANRYRQMGGGLRSAFLLAHEGRGSEALPLFEQVPPGDRDDLFYFERGALLARLGAYTEARQDLDRVLAQDPGHLLAIDVLVQMALAEGNHASAEKRLNDLLAEGGAPSFCHAHLARLALDRGDHATALKEGRQALACGESSPDTLLLTANLLEKTGALDEAEALYSRLPVGGCGGKNLPLAEFWIRQGKHSEKALEAFKAALRQEPQNPRWLFRIAQAYLMRGWKREGADMMWKALQHPELEPSLADEGKALLQQIGR